MSHSKRTPLTRRGRRNGSRSGSKARTRLRCLYDAHECDAEHVSAVEVTGTDSAAEISEHKPQGLAPSRRQRSRGESGHESGRHQQEQPRQHGEDHLP